MKDNYHRVSLSRFCRLLGITRQAYYQHCWHQEFVSIEQELVLQQVHRIRTRHRHMGCRKLYQLLQPFMLDHQIKMGRDALFDLLQAHCLLVRRRKRSIRTTQSFHWLRKYPNVIKGLNLSGPNQLWVSDITYWKNKNGYFYISLITDAFSHKIVGHHVAKSLETVETLQALKKALENLPSDNGDGLIHHSDRGIQYCSQEYVQTLTTRNIRISMTETGDPKENAIAERVNGILKEEYLNDYTIGDLEQAERILDLVVHLYNTERPHISVEFKTPMQVHHPENPLLKYG